MRRVPRAVKKFPRAGMDEHNLSGLRAGRAGARIRCQLFCQQRHLTRNGAGGRIKPRHRTIAGSCRAIAADFHNLAELRSDEAEWHSRAALPGIARVRAGRRQFRRKRQRVLCTRPLPVSRIIKDIIFKRLIIPSRSATVPSRRASRLPVGERGR